MATGKYKDPVTGEWITFAKGSRGEKGDPGEKGEDGKTPDVYVLTGSMTAVLNGQANIVLYKNGEVCTDTTYLYSQVSSGGGEWRNHGTSTGNFKGSKTWSFGGTDAGMAWRCYAYTDSTKTNLLAACFIHGGAKGDSASVTAPEMLLVTFDPADSTVNVDPAQITEHYEAGGVVVWDMDDRDWGYATLTSYSTSNALFTFINLEECLIRQLAVFEDGTGEVFEQYFVVQS